MKEIDIEIQELLHSIDALCLVEKTETEQDAEAKNDEFSIGKLEEMGFGEAQIEEINIGIKQQLPVYRYARECYNWRQMRELRLGLLENIDIGQYDNHLFSAEQMREIRMGLMDHLDVSSYANLLYSTKDMAAARGNLLSNAYEDHPCGYAKQITDEESGVMIRISDDCMQAFMTLPPGKSFDAPELKKILYQNGILCGILPKRLKEAAGEGNGEEILIAESRPAKIGQDGRYEYFFNPLLPDEPKVNEDGSVDYVHVIVADRRKAGDVLARYYPPENGTDGETVTGITVKGESGKQLAPLHGQGIVRDEEKNLYLAAASGYVVVNEKEGTLNVWNVYTVEGDVNRYNGQISYNGMIHIKGSVNDMAHIQATGNVVVDGYVETAQITAGENIILRGGMNGCGRGSLQAGGKIIGKFFEAVDIRAKGNIEGNYFLNCRMITDRSVIAKGAKSRIIGGKVTAGYSVEAFAVTGSGHAQAILDIGNPQWAGERLSQLLEQEKKVQDELARLRKGKEKIGGMLGEGAAEQSTLFSQICIAIRMKNEELEHLSVERQYYEGVLTRAAGAYIKVYGRLQAGTMLLIGGKARRIEEDIEKTFVFRKKQETEVTK